MQAEEARDELGRMQQHRKQLERELAVRLSRTFFPYALLQDMADRVDTLEDRENETNKARKRCEQEISEQRQTIQNLEMDIRKVVK